MFLAQYKVLRENGHSPSEAFNETVEEATQSLFPLIGANGYVRSFPARGNLADLGVSPSPRMDYMYNACSTTPRQLFNFTLPARQTQKRTPHRRQERHEHRDARTVRCIASRVLAS